jgi:hypothetical protein
VFWRLSIFLLPWQTRWFIESQIGGWPWAQGSWSAYVTWLPMIATIVLGTVLFRDVVVRRMRTKNILILLGFVMTSAMAIVLSSNWLLRAIPVIQWWIQIGLLGAFVWTLVETRVSKDSLAKMFALSLVPVALFGCWQFAAQHVAASTWFGVAAQDPRTLGVAVIEVLDLRALRVYGSFPHPNIFGGWLAIGTVVSLWLVSRTSRKFSVIAWSIVSALLAVTLLLTFARGAWIAAAVGIALLVMHLWQRRADTSFTRQYFFVGLLCCAIVVGVIGYTQRVFVFARVEAQGRLETKSIDERTQSLKDGIAIFLKRPIFGSGPNGEMLDILDSSDGHRRNDKAAVPLQPPHNIFLLFLNDFGIAGLMLVGGFLFVHRVAVKAFFVSGYWIVIPLAIVGLFDHYLFSLWAGQVLLFIACLLA